MRWYWIDRFIEFESGRRAKAVKNVTLAEDHLHDHFPGYPLMPNSLVIEGVAQTGGLLVCESTGFQEKVVLAKLSKAKFYSDARPGDTLTYSVVVDDIRQDGAMVTATSHKNEELHAELSIFFAHLDDAFRDKQLYEPGSLLKMMRILRAYEVGVGPDGGPLREPEGNGSVAPANPGGQS
jgi:3-hydroxyacyl-[acyl-carrier-protein] dehydratase